METTEQKTSTPFRAFDSIFNVVQFVALSAIALAAVVGFGLELWRMVTSEGIALGDLLLLFLYTLHGCKFGPRRTASNHVCCSDLYSCGRTLFVEDERPVRRSRRGQRWSELIEKKRARQNRCAFFFAGIPRASNLNVVCVSDRQEMSPGNIMQRTAAFVAFREVPVAVCEDLGIGPGGDGFADE